MEPQFIFEQFQKRFQQTPILLDSINFDGIAATKRDALLSETSELFKANNLDQLVRMSHQASIHMRQMGLFEECQPMISMKIEEQNRCNVKFFVKERPIKGNLKMEMGTNGDLDAGIGARRMNIFGRGESAELTYLKGLREKGGYNFRFTAIKPFLGWRKYNAIQAQVFRNTEYLRWNKSDAMENAAIIQLDTGHLMNRIRSSLRLNLIWRFLLPRKDSAFKIREYAGHTTKISVENVLNKDSRDRPILPTNGSLYRLTTELAGFMGDSAFFKCIFDYQTATQIPFYGLIFGASFRLAQVKSIGEKNVHLLDKVYAGGSYDVRGFELNSLGLRTENCSLGGEAAMTSALHIYLPLIPSDMVFAHLFLNAGSVRPKEAQINYLLERQRISAGFGLALNFFGTARVELNWVFPIRQFPGDSFTPGIQLAAGINFN